MNFAQHYGPWALIAGASEGTGAEFARQLAEQGVNLILVARRQGPLDALAAAIRAAHGVECVTAAIDLARPDSARAMLVAAGDRDVGMLILNAGADTNGAFFLDTDLGNWEALVERNVMGTMRTCHMFATGMKARGRGAILVVGSGACYSGLPGIAVYGATKAFALALCESLWAELKPHGIDVLHYVIGRTDTPAHRELMAARGMAIPDDLADPGKVARIGLAHIGKGPVKNWDLADDDAGWAGTSAAARRTRVEASAAMAAAYAGNSQ